MMTLATTSDNLYNTLQRYQAASTPAATCSSDSSSSSDDDSDDEKPLMASCARPKAPTETCANYTKFDVLLGRGRAFQLYPGNRRFHALVNANADKYVSSTVQSGKWKITMEIVETVLAKGRFLKPSKAHGWTVVSLDTARQKVAHSLQYQNRRQSKKQMPIKCGSNTKAVTVEVDDGSDHDDSNDDQTAMYPNVNRTYFCATPAVVLPCVTPVSSAVSTAALSATEKYLHGMATIQAVETMSVTIEVASTPELLALPSTGIQPIVRCAMESTSLTVDDCCWKALTKNYANQATISKSVAYQTSESDLLSMDMDEEWDLSDFNFLSQANFGESSHDESLNMDNLFEFFEQNLSNLDDSSTCAVALMPPPVTKAPLQPQQQYRPASLGKRMFVDTTKKCDELGSTYLPVTTEENTPLFYPIELNANNDCSLVSLDLIDILEDEYQNEQSSSRADFSTTDAAACSVPCSETLNADSDMCIW